MPFDFELRRRWRQKGESKDREKQKAELKDREKEPSDWPSPFFADNQDEYRDTIEGIFHGRPDDAEADLARMLAPNFSMRSGGHTYNFAQFVEHVRSMRTKRVRLNVQVIMFLRDGNKLAAHYLSTVRRPNGDIYRTETLQFAELTGDGRLCYVVRMPMISNLCAEWPDY